MTCHSQKAYNLLLLPVSVNNGVGAGTGTGAGAGGEVLGARDRWIFLGCSKGGVLLRCAVGSSFFGVDALSNFFFFLETTSFHSPGGEWSVVGSKSVTVVGVLGLASGGALLSSVVGDSVTHTHRVIERGCQSRWRGRRLLGIRHLVKVVDGSKTFPLVGCFPLRSTSGKLPSYF